MPSSSRAAQVDLSATPYYHCISRCVRRAFLCGEDSYDGSNYEHRKTWIIERLKLATDVFAIDVCAYAILSNHFHTVLRVDAARASAWTDEATIRRYARLFPRAARAVRELPAAARRDRVKVLRERLTDLSWFMRVLNEYIARRANREDGCKGRFWEGRFKSQALLDEAALYTCMSYVDLNPVRAGMSSSLQASAFTSIEQRLREAARTSVGDNSSATAEPLNAVALVPLRGEGRGGNRAMLEVRFNDYVALLEWTGRAARAKGGRIRGAPPALLTTLNIRGESWLEAMSGAGIASLTVLGRQDTIDAEAERRGKRWLKGKGSAEALFRRVL